MITLSTRVNGDLWLSMWKMLSIELYLEQHRVIDIERRLLLLAAFITGENGDVV